MSDEIKRIYLETKREYEDLLAQNKVLNEQLQKALKKADYAEKEKKKLTDIYQDLCIKEKLLK